MDNQKYAIPICNEIDDFSISMNLTVWGLNLTNTARGPVTLTQGTGTKMKSAEQEV